MLDQKMGDATANRPAIRVGQEPLERCRQFPAYHCKTQTECCLLPQPVSHLAEFRDARNRGI